MLSVLSKLPLQQLLLESDAPALAPVKPTAAAPQRNEPANLRLTLEVGPPLLLLN
jgi:Tat protein secretion system quality control protein TatD with DNase activity